MGTVARRAGRIVPAVAMVGALAAAPHVYHLAMGSSSANLASDLAAGHRASLGDGRHPLSQSTPSRFTVNVPAHVASPADTADPASKLAPGKTAPVRHRAATTRTVTAKPSPSPAPATPAGPDCDGASGGMLPANYAVIVTFLMAHGYSGLGAAGVAGNIYQESKGNPESVGTGGGGLIGWTPLPSGFVTGNPSADLQTQLSALLTYNDQWSGYLPALNAATSATDAAYIYMTDFERPGIPAAYNRESAADAVAAACHL
jgi:Phage tail lysozyme